MSLNKEDEQYLIGDKAKKSILEKKVHLDISLSSATATIKSIQERFSQGDDDILPLNAFTSILQRILQFLITPCTTRN
jgi:hypothetical protein